MLMLNVDQNIKNNLGSNQLIDLLDELLMQALDAALTYTPRAVMEWIANVLHDVVASGEKRLFSTLHSNTELIQRLMKALQVCSIEAIANCELDRVYAFAFINTLKPKLHAALNGAPVMTLRGYTDANLQSAYLELEYFSEKAETFVRYIAEKYYRYALLRTNLMIKNTQLEISKDDLYANNAMMMFRAILKYSSKKGTLTAFINTWMQANSNPKFAHEYGTAYHLPPGKRRSMIDSSWQDNGVAVINLAHPIEDADHIPVGLSGSMSGEFQEDEERSKALAEIVSSLAYDPDVQFYMRVHSMPHIRRKPIDYSFLKQAKPDRVNPDTNAPRRIVTRKSLTE